MTPAPTKSRRRTGPPASQLLLMIDTTLYGVKPLRDDPAVAARAFRLHKPDGTLYDVEETPFGPVCDCPDYVYRRDGLDPEGCKHVRALVAGGLIGTEGAPVPHAAREREAFRAR